MIWYMYIMQLKFHIVLSLISSLYWIQVGAHKYHIIDYILVQLALFYFTHLETNLTTLSICFLDARLPQIWTNHFNWGSLLQLSKLSITPRD